MQAWVLLALLPATALLTWLARRYALRRALLDMPGERRSHDLPTPRGGGIAIAVVMAFTLLLPGLWPEAARWPLLAGLCLMAGIGWRDDHRPQSVWLRLLVQLAAGGCVAWAAIGLDAPWPWLGVLLVPVLVNVWNFMDGIDGIATSQAALVALALGCWMPPPLAVPAWALLLACLGFLPANLIPRVRVFLGDVGSYTLGYLLAALLVSAMTAPAPSPLLLLPLSAFLLDATLTLVMRIRRGERWWQPHRQHLYQRLALRARRHAPVTLLYAGWTALASIAMIALADASAVTQGVSVLVACMLGAILWWWGGQRLRESQGSSHR